MVRGKFLVLEGTEGVGKSTNLAVIADLLRERNIEVIVTREPGGTALGEKLRSALLDQREEIVPMAELLMIFAARAQHISQIIQPALQAGKWVLSDRFTDASYAYQGGGRGIPLATIAQLEQQVQHDLRPDLVLLLDAAVSVGQQRMQQRGQADRFEQEQQDFFERVRTVYRQRAEANPERYLLIDAGQELTTVKQQIAQSLTEWITKNGL